MKKSSSSILVVVIGVLAIGCCSFSVGALGVFVWLSLTQPIDVEMGLASPTESDLQASVPIDTPVPFPTATATPTAKPMSSATPTPTYTLVIQPGTPLPPLGPAVRNPTRVSPYTVVIPTPTQSALRNPVAYESRFAVQTYSVTGKTLTEISKSLDENTAISSYGPGTRYYAQTEWYLSTVRSWKETARGCQVDSSKVSVAITMTLPVLVTASEIPPDVLARWEHFLDNTITHESGHVTLAMDGARTLQRDMGDFPPAPNCDVIRMQLDSLFKEEYDRIASANAQYDVKTQHGRTQGAVFP